MAPNPVAYPLGAPTLNGTQISVDTMLQQPTRVTRLLMDMTLQRLLLDRLFVSAGGVSGGALIYDTATVNELYLDRDVAQVAPGGEFPIVSGPRRAPNIAVVEKWGGKVYITDEARDRNDQAALRNELTRLGNTIIRKLNQRAIDELEKAITANSGLSNMVGHNWNSVIVGGSNQTNVVGMPAADFAAAQLSADVAELGGSFDLLLLNPAQKYQLGLVYGDKLAGVLQAYGIDEVYASNRVPAGTGYFIQKGQVGEIRIEKALGTETWRENGKEQTWVQASVRPLFAVTNPFAVLKVTGLAG